MLSEMFSVFSHELVGPAPRNWILFLHLDIYSPLYSKFIKGSSHISPETHVQIQSTRLYSYRVHAVFPRPQKYMFISFVRSKKSCLEKKFSSVKVCHRPPTFFHVASKALIYARVPPPIPTHKQSNPSMLYIHMLCTCAYTCYVHA